MENSLSLLLVPIVVPFPKRRFGCEGDGGYVICDGLKFSALYSYGIGNNVSFDADIANHLGISVHQYDHTIEKAPLFHEKFLFHRQGVGIATLEDGPIDTVANHILQNGDKEAEDLLLKMDIEGDEWNIFDGISPHDLVRFSCIVTELHWLTRADETAIRALRKLHATHVIAHLHGNNNSGVHPSSGIPDVVEVTWIRKDLLPSGFVQVPDTNGKYPDPKVDFPNRGDLPDLTLGWWKKPDGNRHLPPDPMPSQLPPSVPAQSSAPTSPQLRPNRETFHRSTLPRPVRTPARGSAMICMSRRIH